MGSQVERASTDYNADVSTDPATRPTGTSGLPVRSVRVEVIRGQDTGRSLTARGEDAVRIGTAEGNDLALTDPTVSRYHLELRRHGDRMLVIDLGSTNGVAIGHALLRDARAHVAPGAVLELGDTALRIADGQVELVEQGPDRIGSGGELVGRTPSMRRLLGAIEQVAQSDVAVLVLGESGTGKELVARAIHGLSPRAAQPFVTVDCGATSPALFTSELFGHERGAFTGAERRHAGAFERAESGTVFLDEIGELPAPLQTALLGVLERRVIRRVGGTEDIPIDVRVVAATNRDLRRDVNRGAFRLDLYYRVAVVLLEIPPLRERAADLPLLVEHFLREAGASVDIGGLFDSATLRAMHVHSWPGNVRELRNAVEAALVTGAAPRLDGIATGSALPAGDAVLSSVLGLPYRAARAAVLDEFERRYLADLLARNGGNVRQAAREARMDRTYLHELLRRHGLR